MSSSRRRAAALFLLALLPGLPGCDEGSRDPSELAQSSDDELVVLPRLSTWTVFRISRRGRVRIEASVGAGARVAAAVTDHWGWVSGRSRPDPTIDVEVRDDRDRSLGPRFHNTSRDDNGTEPDPMFFTAPASGVVVLDVREVDGYAGAFEVRLDPARADEPTPPPGVVVHESGDTSKNVSPATSFAALLAGGGRDHDRRDERAGRRRRTR